MVAPRWTWYLPLVALAIASVGLIIAGVLAWGATGEADFPDWIPTFSGALLGTVCLLAAMICAIRLRRSLASPYHVRGVRIAAGLIATVILIFIITATVTAVGDSSRYRAYDGDESTAIHLEDIWGQDPRFGDGSSTGFVTTTFVAIFPGPISWCIAAMYFFYAKGFDPVSKDVPPVDAIGEIMKTA